MAMLTNKHLKDLDKDDIIERFLLIQKKLRRCSL